ncbi:MAG: hypothetical protein Q4B91_04865 [Atopobiaceae bacterium]|nr:hypothetical protein [Atopobiaceae bacterium]
MRMPEQKSYVEPEDRATRVSDLVLRYGVILGRRFSRGQKRRFLAAAAQQFELCGFKASLEEDRCVVRLAGSKRFHNLYAGDLSRARAVFVTYYDTPVKAFGRRPVRAFDTNFRPTDAWVSMAGLAASVLLAVAFLALLVWPRIAVEGAFSVWGLLFLAVCVAVLALVTTCREGVAERENLVRNSSSLAVLFDLAREAQAAGLADRVAFALVDEGCRSERGLEMLRSRLGRRGPKRVYVDSLGSDGRLVCLTNLRTPASWKGGVDVRALSAPDRKRFGDYLVCAASDADEELTVNRASEVSVERVMARSDALLELAESL